jgi:hypothetical protein
MDTELNEEGVELAIDMDENEVMEGAILETRTIKN